MRTTAILVTLAFTGCATPSRPAAPAGPAAATSPAPPDAATPAPALAPDEKLTAANLERLDVALDACALTAGGLDESCPAWIAQRDATTYGGPHSLPSDEDMTALEVAVASKLVVHASPQVRVFAVGVLLSTERGADRATAAAAIAAETDPTALVPMTLQIARNAAQPELTALVLQLATHPEVKVRRLIAVGLGDARGVAGVFDRAVAMCRDDADPEARGQACLSAGRLGDPAVLPLYRQLLVATTDPWVYDHCVQGAIALWHEPGNASEAAYRLSIDLLAHGPDRAGAPSSETVGRLVDLASELTADPARWRAQPWVKLSEVRDAMLAIAGAASADVNARFAAIDGLPGLGAAKATMRALRQRIGDDDPQHDDVRDAIDGTIATMK